MFICFSCKNNSESSETADGEISMTKSVVETEEDIDNMVEEEMKKMEVVEKVDTTVKNKVLTKLDDISEEKKAEMKQVKQEALKKNLESSPNKGKSCDDILVEYDKLVDNFLASPTDQSVVLKMVNIKNDPIFSGCKDNKAFLTRLNEIEAKMDEDEDY